MNEYKQIYATANEIVGQMDGAKELGEINTNNVVDLGKVLNDLNLAGEFNNQMAMKLARTYILTREANDIQPDLMADSYDWGIVTEWISVDQPVAIIDEAFEIQDGSSVDQYVVTMPKTTVKYYAQEQKWVVKITRFKEQLKSVFDSAEVFERFWSAIEVEVRNAIREQYSGLSYLALDTAIAQTICDEYTTSYATDYAANTSVKAINLLKEFNDAQTAAGLSTISADSALTNKEFIRFANLKMRRVKSRMNDFSRAFNIDGRKWRTPESEMKYFIHSDYVSAASSYLYSGEFNKDDVYIPQGYQEVNRWQAIDANAANTYDWDVTSAIDITTTVGGSDVEVSVKGIVAVMMDKYAAIVFNQLEDTLTTPINAYGRYLNIFHHMNSNYQFHPEFNFVFFYIAEPEGEGDGGDGGDGE